MLDKRTRRYKGVTKILGLICRSFQPKLRFTIFSLACFYTLKCQHRLDALKRQFESALGDFFISRRSNSYTRAKPSNTLWVFFH